MPPGPGGLSPPLWLQGPRGRRGAPLAGPPERRDLPQGGGLAQGRPDHGPAGGDGAPGEGLLQEARKKERDLAEGLVRFCHRLLLDAPEAQEARTYLEARGLPSDRWELWDLGFMPEGTPPLVQWAKEAGWSWEDAKAALRDAGLLLGEDGRDLWVLLHGRVVAPWRGAGDSILGWWGRKLPKAPPDAPKYLYSAGSWRSRPYLLERSGRGERLLLVEGVLDAIQCREHGFPAVALGGVGLGSYLLPLRSTSPEGVVLVLDPDEAGRKAARSAVAKLLGAGLSVYLVDLPTGEKGEKLDPDAFLRERGPEAFRRLVEEAPNALRWKARDLLDAHRGAGWTDQATEDVIREALAFAGKLPLELQPYIRPMFLEELGAEILITNEALEEVYKATHEEAERERREKATRAVVQDTSKKLEMLLEDGRPEDALKLLMDQATALRAEAFNAPRTPPRVALDELDAHQTYLEALRGRDRVGLAQSMLPLLDEALMGLRGLMLLAGPPNCGKTTLALQLGLGAMEEDPEAAVVLLSLEQARFEHLTRTLAQFSGLDWKTVAMGSHGRRDEAHRLAGDLFTAIDARRLREGGERLKALAGRLLILDDENFQDPTAESILHQVEALKERTGAGKVLVIVDYLQLWPVPLEQAKAIRTDLDRDKWQIGELKKLKNRMGASDAVMVISEAKKEDWKESLGMGSVMGSARGTYTPDVVMVLQPLQLKEYAPGVTKEKEQEEAGAAKYDELVSRGLALMHLRIVKGRDGVQRGAFELAFHYLQTRFEETTFSSHLS